MIVLRIILKEILKAYFTLISSQMKSQSNFGKVAIKYKTAETRLVLYIWHREYLMHCPFCVLDGLKEEKYK